MSIRYKTLRLVIKYNIHYNGCMSKATNRNKNPNKVSIGAKISQVNQVRDCKTFVS